LVTKECYAHVAVNVDTVRLLVPGTDVALEGV